MKLLAIITLALTFPHLPAQTSNKLHDINFWKSQPSVNEVKQAIEEGNDPAAMNAMEFDAVALAINNNASTDVIAWLLQQEGNAVTKTTNHLRTYLHWATARGNAAVVKLLLEKGSDVNAPDSHGDTPLQFAAGFGMNQPAIYDLYRKAGVDLKQRNKNGATYMMLGIPHDSTLALTDYLAGKGLSLNDTDKGGATLFDYAARTGNLTTLKTLRARGVKATGKALLMAAQGTRRAANGLEVYKYLMEDVKLKPTVTDDEGNTLLHLVARKSNQLPVISYLMSKGLNPNTLNKEGSNMLIVAAGGSDSELIKMLVKQTPDVNFKNVRGESALTSAVNSGSIEIMQMLLEHKADVRVRDVKGNHLGYYLVQSYRPARGGAPATPAPANRPAPSTIVASVATPANRPVPASANRPQNAPSDDFTDKMKLLISSGLDITQPMADNSTLYHIAAQKEDLELFRKLSALAIDINAKNSEEMTVLHKIALTAHNDKLMQFLIEKGADKKATTEFGETAYELAAANEYLINNSINIEFLK
jgi:ankyrin repeat protein